MLKVSDLYRYFNEHDINQLMVLYRDEKGDIKSLAYQDLVFFEPIAHKRYRVLGKPSEILDIIEGLKSGRYKLVGKGYYSRPIEFKKERGII